MTHPPNCSKDHTCDVGSGKYLITFVEEPKMSPKEMQQRTQSVVSLLQEKNGFIELLSEVNIVVANRVALENKEELLKLGVKEIEPDSTMHISG